MVSLVWSVGAVGPGSKDFQNADLQSAKCKVGQEVIFQRQKEIEEPFIENIRHNEQSRGCEHYSDQGTSDHVIRVVVVVADPFTHKNDLGCCVTVKLTWLG